MTINKQLKVVRGDNARLHETEPHEIVELFNEDGTVYSPNLVQVEAGEGTPIIRAFPFSFDTANLLTGHTFYTPTIGDILLTYWIEVLEAWDGTTPKGDFGPFTGGDPSGILSNTMQSKDMTDPVYTPSPGEGVSYAFPTGANYILIPVKILTDDPFKLIVTQDGLLGGADPGSTQGSAILYLVTVTPI